MTSTRPRSRSIWLRIVPEPRYAGHLYDDPAKADVDEIAAGSSGETTGPESWRSPGSTPAPECDSPSRTHRGRAAINEGRRPTRVFVCVDGVHGFGLIAATMPELDVTSS